MVSFGVGLIVLRNSSCAKDISIQLYWCVVKHISKRLPKTHKSCSPRKKNNKQSVGSFVFWYLKQFFYRIVTRI